MTGADNQATRRMWRPFLSLVLQAITWGGLIAPGAIASLKAANDLMTPHVSKIGILYFLGASLAYLLAMPVARYFTRHRHVIARFLIITICLGASTASVTAIVFALEYREFYSRWHDPLFSLAGILQFVFTLAGAVYQFSVIGLRLYFPYGIALLLLFSLILARRMR